MQRPIPAMNTQQPIMLTQSTLCEPNNAGSTQLSLEIN